MRRRKMRVGGGSGGGSGSGSSDENRRMARLRAGGDSGEPGRLLGRQGWAWSADQDIHYFGNRLGPLVGVKNKIRQFEFNSVLC